MKYRQYLSLKYEKKCRNILRFALVGATGALLNLSIIYTLTNYIHIWYMISALVAIESSILWNFYLNTKVTFNYRFQNRSELFAAIFRYHLLSFTSTIINLAALLAFTEFFKIYFMFSEILAIMLAFGINYFISARYVWSEKKNI
ncbi:MAG: GtrA-like protein [Methanosaeta sp. PtaU1.Bin112]|nr:MAG: GtrA-like protein [Methanosaeta sp. PtaU1.Bin112]